MAAKVALKNGDRADPATVKNIDDMFNPRYIFLYFLYFHL